MSIHSRPARSRRALNKTTFSDGMTLIEVLVTLVIISVGLLGVAALQLATVRNNYDAFLRSQAAVLAGDVLDRMRANRRAALNGDYRVNFDQTFDTPTTAAQRDVGLWKTTLDTQLPAGGDGQIEFNAATQIATIRIRWGERAELDADRTVTFVTSSQI